MINAATQTRANTHTHTRARAHARTCTHARTHTHTHRPWNGVSSAEPVCDPVSPTGTGSVTETATVGHRHRFLLDLCHWGGNNAQCTTFHEILQAAHSRLGRCTGVALQRSTIAVGDRKWTYGHQVRATRLIIMELKLRLLLDNFRSFNQPNPFFLFFFLSG